jgi:hypothetical protein
MSIGQGTAGGSQLYEIFRNKNGDKKNKQNAKNRGRNKWKKQREKVEKKGVRSVNIYKRELRSKGDRAKLKELPIGDHQDQFYLVIEK